jgi:hypothetical protein
MVKGLCLSERQPERIILAGVHPGGAYEIIGRLENTGNKVLLDHLKSLMTIRHLE